MGLFVLLLLLGAVAADAKSVISLGSQTWTVENGNQSISATTTLPAYPLEILRSKGIVEEPLFRFGELTTRWVALDNWTFSLSFDGSSPEMQELRSQKQVLLKFGGIDTFAAATLNGKHILDASNFHRHFSVPVKGLLQDGQNELQITITPATTESERLKDSHPYTIPALKQMGAVGAYTFVRKPASDLGWDWGPAFAASGIHGDVELVGFSNAVLEGSYVSQRKVGDMFELAITSELVAPPGGDTGELSVAIPALNKTYKVAVQLNNANPASIGTTFTVNASEVDLWWPVGYGAPNLYDVSITYTPDTPACPAATHPHSSGASRGSKQPAAAKAGGRAHAAVKAASQSRRGQVLAKSTSRREKAQQYWAQTTADGAFRIMQGFDLPGALAFAKRNTDSLQECQKMCQKSPECGFYTFSPPPNGFCWLKKLPEVPGAVFGVKLDDGKYDLTPGLNLAGFDLEKPTAVANVSACETRCNGNDKCKMFVVMEGKCHMKEPWAATISRLLGAKLTGSHQALAAGTPAAAAQQPADMQEEELPAAVPDLAHPATAAAPAPAAASRSASSDAAEVPFSMIDLSKGSSAAAAPGGHYGSTVAPGGYYGTAATPGDYALGGYGTLEEIVNAINDLLPHPQPEEPTDNADDSAAAACAAAATSELNHRIGFRTIELVRLPIPAAVKDLFPPGQKGWDTQSTYGVSKGNWDGSWAMSSDGRWQHFPKPGDQEDIEGESFYFKVNSVPIYMKGANLVPLHILPTNVSKDMIHDLLKYALESNMNMIRIWGGGMYPVDELFKFTDEHGLLVWMETMFACAPYPRNQEFMENVASEVTQQVHRLSWHPSVAAWSGNNEIEGSLGWYSETRTNKQLFAGDYIALFVDTIRNIIKQANPSIAFVDSSPSNGAIVDNNEQYIKRWGDDWDPRYGDVHHYAYDADCEDFSTYPKAKFISEFGSQSYPTFATYAEATVPSDWQVDNPMTGFRNRRFGNGLEVFEAQFKRHFRLPSAWSSADDPQESYKLFRSFLYITHMQQSRCYEAAINYWRRLRSQPAALTMGVLYWQLNDIAPFASWSAYDYGGRWKPLAYTVKRMYAPLQVQVIQDGPQAKVFVVNDHMETVNTTITVNVLSLQDTAAACDAQQPAAAEFTTPVPPGYADMVWTMPTEDLLAGRTGCTATSCYIAVTAQGKLPTSTGAIQTEVSEAQMFLVPLKTIDLPDPELELSGFTSATASSANSTAEGVRFTLKSGRPAVLTQFDTGLRGRFSDDAFTAVHPCQPKQVTFYPHSSVGDLSPAQLQANLTVASLFNHQFGQAGNSSK